MNPISYRRLLETAKTRLKESRPLPPCNPTNVFKHGAQWMADALAQLRGHPLPEIPETNFGIYGYGKYGISTLAMLLTAFIAIYFDQIYLIPLAVVTFYLVEIQFLFLFPVLVDRKKAPIRTSLRLTRQAGYLRTLCTVIPIATFMILGGLGRTTVKEAWLVGCMAILIWYEEVVNEELGTKIA